MRLPLLIPSFSVALCALPLATACRDGLGACDEMRDVSGPWQITAVPAAVVAMGKSTIPRATTMTATLEQQPSSNLFGLGALVYGTVASDDKGFFDSLAIPRLKMNDGSKTGAALGCRVTLNVPIESNVSDDNVKQGPMRVSLAGRVTAFGGMLSVPELSTVVMTDDPLALERTFEWTATYMGTVDGGFVPPDFGLSQQSSLAPSHSALVVGRKPAPKRKKGKGKSEPEPSIAGKGPIAVHLVGFDVERRRIVLELTGLVRPPKANFVTFTDDRGRKFVGVSVDCQEPDGNQRRCEIELPPGYEKRKLAGIELHTRGLHGPTTKVPLDDLSTIQPDAE